LHITKVTIHIAGITLSEYVEMKKRLDLQRRKRRDG